MKVVNRSVYLGPSLYALFPVIRLTLQLGELEEWSVSWPRCRR
jgi:cyanophycin synthetase